MSKEHSLFGEYSLCLKNIHFEILIKKGIIISGFKISNKNIVNIYLDYIKIY